MKMLMLMFILLSINLMFTKHQLLMGSILLMQTIFSSLTCSMKLNSHFMSYILFLIFIGGMLILFLYMYMKEFYIMYMASIASNEKVIFQ